MPLANTKHEAVALAYLTDPEHIGWRAYASVYPKCNQHAAETQWSRLLKNVEFAARIAELGTAAAQGAVMSANEVLEELSKLARSNMLDYIGNSGQLLDLSQLTREHAAAVQEVTTQTYTERNGEDSEPVKRVKFKLYDKRAALVDLGKHHVLFTEKHVHEFGGVAERLAAALERIGDRDAEAPHEGKPKRVQARRKGSKSNPSRRRSG